MASLESSINVTIGLDREQFHAVVSKLDHIIEMLAQRSVDADQLAKLTAKLKESEKSLRDVVAQGQASSVREAVDKGLREADALGKPSTKR